MAQVYILYSKRLNRYYTGSCLDIEKRIIEHRSKAIKGSFTSKTDDWEVFYYFDNLEYKQARGMELHIKKMRSKKYIENLKKFPELRMKLIDRYS